MASQFQLFKRRRFSAMFFTQFLGAFNDNIFKQALILVLTYTAASQLGVEVSILNNLAAMLFILPYFLLSGLAIDMNSATLLGISDLFQMGTSLAILLGMIVAGVLTQLPQSLYWISGTVLIIAILGYLAAR